MTPLSVIIKQKRKKRLNFVLVKEKRKGKEMRL
jgi:hypothetical protein